MLNNRKEYRKKRYEALASTSKVFSSPSRLEIIDSLIQGPSSVEALARSVGKSVASTSQHLQVLRRAYMVRTVRDGTTITYHLLDDVRPIFITLRRFAEKESPELKILKLDAEAGIPFLSFQETVRMLEDDKAVILDLRSKIEYESAHIKDAYSLPFLELLERMAELPNDKVIIVACRGPYCTTSIECVDILKEHGFQAYRYDGGIGEWEYHGGQISSH
jgi:rhodanese-related sulfurtransferase